MNGEKPTNKALQPSWQGALRPQECAQETSRCRIVVVGIGETGNNAIAQLAKMGTKNAHTIAINTNSSHLNKVQADEKMLIRRRVTRHLGENRKPALREKHKQVEKSLNKADIIFITSSLSSETGTEVSPTIAEMARKKGTTTVGVVTRPLQTKKGQMKLCAKTLAKLRQACHMVIVIDNEKLMELAPTLALDEAHQIIAQMLAKTIKEMLDTISTPSLMNLDTVDFRTIVKRGGVAAVGTGESNAPNRVEEAVQNALKSPLLNTDYEEATNALVYVTGDSQLTLEEASRAAEIVTEMMNNRAQVVWGARVDPELAGKLKVTLLMTGIDSPTAARRGLDSATPQLFNLEPHPEPERRLPIDLNLYQLENY
jgi:cell division protein FtsZ